MQVKRRSKRVGLSVTEDLKMRLEVLADYYDSNLNDTCCQILQKAVDEKAEVIEPLVMARNTYMQTVKRYASQQQ